MLANIFHRPMRSLATILAVGLEVALILTIVGLTQGIVMDSAKRIEGIGADIILRPPGASFLMATSAAPMPIKISEALYAVKGVRYVTPVLTELNSQGGLDLIYGIDLPSFNEVSSGFIFRSGSEFQDPMDVIIDDIYAHSRKLKIGDHVTFLNHSFKVCGIVEHGKGSRIYLPIQTMQNLMGVVGRASLMYIKCHSKQDVPEVTKKLKELLPGYTVLRTEEFVSQMSSAINDMAALRYFINLVTFIAALVGFFVIFLAMYTTITERTREIGILKSLGASKGYVLAVFMKEALSLCLLGFLFGILLSFGGELLIRKIFPSLQIVLGLEWIFKAAVIAVVSASLGAFYPAIRAAAQDPIDALAYEV
ncbi:MAG: ABC transporter permease [Acidobacteria bacterium]|nr:MAG: ABC transporter permease [Acidobacteriota bacterium]